MKLLRRFFRPQWVRMKVRGRTAELWGEAAYDDGHPLIAAIRWLEATAAFWFASDLGPPEEREMLLAEAQQCARRAASAADRVADVLTWEEQRARTHT